MGRYAIWLSEVLISWKRENLEQGTVYSQLFAEQKGSPKLNLFIKKINHGRIKNPNEVCGWLSIEIAKSKSFNYNRYWDLSWEI